MTLVQKEIKRVCIRPNGTEKQIRPEIPLITGIYHSPSLGLISLSSDGSTWITIADKNLGATQVYNDGDTLSEANCGKYYQWGNNYGFSWTGYAQLYSGQTDASNYGPGNYYNSSIFYYGQYYSDWSNVKNDNLWGGEIGTVEAMQGPCNSGYHIPSVNELTSLVNIMIALGINSGDMKTYLKMPSAGARYYLNGNPTDQGSSSIYWSASAAGNNAYVLWDASGVNGNFRRNWGCSIRPFKNTPVQPDDSRTVLYQ